MYFRKSSDIAKDRPEIEAVVTVFDSFLRRRRDLPFRVVDASDHLNIDPRLLSRIAELYMKAGVLVQIDALVCPEHHEILCESEDGLWYCDLCDAGGYEEEQVASVTLYRLAPTSVEELLKSSEWPTIVVRRRKRDLVDLLVSLPTTSTFQGRAQLLYGIVDAGNFDRNEANRRLDLELIVEQVFGLRSSGGEELPIIVLIDNVLPIVHGYDGERILREIRDELTNEQ